MPRVLHRRGLAWQASGRGQQGWTGAWKYLLEEGVSQGLVAGEALQGVIVQHAAQQVHGCWVAGPRLGPAQAMSAPDPDVHDTGSRADE